MKHWVFGEINEFIIYQAEEVFNLVEISEEERPELNIVKEGEGCGYDDELKIITIDLNEVSEILSDIGFDNNDDCVRCTEEIIKTTLTVIVYHEVAHALYVDSDYEGQGLSTEAGADVVSGYLSGYVGLDMAIGRSVMLSIGCLGRYCEHQSPEERASHYVLGYEQGEQEKKDSLIRVGFSG